MREWVSMNGTLCPAEQAQVSVFDSGFMQGIGLFETMRAYNGVVFRLDRHLERLTDSARELGWSVAPDIDELRDNVEQVVGATEQADARVRLTVTTGSLHGSGDAHPRLTIVANASPNAGYPRECYTKGVSVIRSSFIQSGDDPTVGHKTTSYFSRLHALREAHAAGAFEAIWFNREGLLAEGSISSVFVVRDDQLLTPSVDTPILPGITRSTVIELAVDCGIPVRESAITFSELLETDEVFLTNSMMELIPVVRIGREPIGDEKPGDTLRALYEAYGKCVERECAYA